MGNEDEDKPWTTTFISRGFSFKTKNRSDLICFESEDRRYEIWEPRNKSFLPALRKVIKAPVFFIMIQDKLLTEPTKVEWLNSQSISKDLSESTHSFGVI